MFNSGIVVQSRAPAGHGLLFSNICVVPLFMLHRNKIDLNKACIGNGAWVKYFKFLLIENKNIFIILK